MQGDVKLLTPVEVGAWRGFLRAHAELARELDDELVAEHGLSLRGYEVLLLLHESPRGRLRMSDLADQALLSLSGTTRVVDRLAREGFVRRTRVEGDGRGVEARPTKAGTRLFRQARATHLAGVRARFLSHFSVAELDALAATWERLRA